MTFSSLTLLGSTGSIGTQTLDVLRALKGRITLAGLSAGGGRLPEMAAQIIEFQPGHVHLAEESKAEELKSLLKGKWAGELYFGDDGLAEIAAKAPADIVLIATFGWTGLPPALAAIEAGRAVALANKEALVCGGTLLTDAATKRNVPILPVDSEHNAIFQCLASSARGEVRRLILTCSGGPYRTATREAIHAADARTTLRHPTWIMGSKVTVDSATLMNKGFEVIEAHHLFDMDYDKIDVVIHPQSIVHSMVEFVDGSMLAQLGPPDMKVPIQYALTYPHRVSSPGAGLRLSEMATLTFEEPDHERFPALRLAYAAGKAGGSAPCVLNAANEVAVRLHLDGKITCGNIPGILSAVMNQHHAEQTPTLDSLRKWDRWGRDAAMEAAREVV